MNLDVPSILKALPEWQRQLILGSMVEKIDPTSLPWTCSDRELLTPLWNALWSLDEVDQYGLFRRSVGN
jgi:hypothetical protein